VDSFQLTKNRPGNDRYTERSMNTFNDLPKNKMTQTTKITHHDASSYATVWDMYDTYKEKQGQNAKWNSCLTTPSFKSRPARQQLRLGSGYV